MSQLIYLHTRRPQRPWAVRIRQRLLQQDIVYWLLVLLAGGITTVVCLRIPS